MPASWAASDWFGEVTGILNTGTTDAEDVLVRGDAGDVVAEADYVAPGEELPLPAGTGTASVSWRDGAGMHADVVSCQP